MLPARRRRSVAHAHAGRAQPVAATRDAVAAQHCARRDEQRGQQRVVAGVRWGAAAAAAVLPSAAPRCRYRQHWHATPRPLRHVWRGEAGGLRVSSGAARRAGRRGAGESALGQPPPAPAPVPLHLKLRWQRQRQRPGLARKPALRAGRACPAAARAADLVAGGGGRRRQRQQLCACWRVHIAAAVPHKQAAC